MPAVLEEFEPILGKPKVEWAGSCSGSGQSSGFLFYVHSPDSSHLRVYVSDFGNTNLESVRSVLQLEDMTDSVGIRGSLSFFIQYLVASIKSEDVKLLLVALPNSSEQERCLQLTKVISAEKKRMKVFRAKLISKRHKLQRTMNSSDKADISAPLMTNGQNSPENPTLQITTSKLDEKTPNQKQYDNRGGSLSNRPSQANHTTVDGNSGPGLYGFNKEDVEKLRQLLTS